MKKKIIILAAFVVTFFTACTSTHMITFSNAELSDKEKDMIENNSNYSTASIVGGSAKLVKEERDKAIQEKIEAIQEKIEARRNKLKAIDGLSISSYKDKNGKEQFKATAQSEILFKFDSYELNEEAQKMLSDLCNIITEIPNTKIKIIGHTDNIGEKQYNIILSKNRAAAVGNYLRTAGIETNNITEDGKGYSKPIADNTSEAGRAKNRRVEIFITNDEY